MKTTVIMILAMGAAIGGSLATAMAASLWFYPADLRRVDTFAGAEVFKSRCASCHAIGNEERAGYGPSLVNIGKTAQTRIPGYTAEQYLLESILAPDKFKAPGSSGEMPKTLGGQLSRKELLNVLGYLLAQGADVPYHRLLTLSLDSHGETKESREDVSLTSVEAGKQLFWGRLQCFQCHVLDGTPGSTLVAPSLEKIGLQSRAYLTEAIREPSKHLVPGYGSVMIVDDGKVITGRPLKTLAGSARLLLGVGTDTWRVQQWSLSNLEPVGDGEEVVQPLAVSPMPSYAQSLTAEELDSLLDYLATMR